MGIGLVQRPNMIAYSVALVDIQSRGAQVKSYSVWPAHQDFHKALLAPHFVYPVLQESTRINRDKKHVPSASRALHHPFLTGMSPVMCAREGLNSPNMEAQNAKVVLRGGTQTCLEPTTVQIANQAIIKKIQRGSCANNVQLDTT